MVPTDITQNLRLMAVGMFFLMMVAVGTAALIWQTVREWGQPPHLELPAWRATWRQFCVWLLLIISALYLARMLVWLVVPMPAGATAESEKLDPAYMLPRLVIAEFVILLAQVLLVIKASPFSPAPVNRASRPAGSLAASGALAYLTALPLIVVTGLGWRAALFLIRHWIPDLETPLQDPILLMIQTHHPGQIAVLLFCGVVLAPINEELFFRASLYRFLKYQTGRRFALVAVNLLFALAHGNTLNFLPLLVIGLLLTRAYERSGHVVTPMIFHGLFNLTNMVCILVAPDLIQNYHPGA
jgi:uncharacterized protein